MRKLAIIGAMLTTALIISACGSGSTTAPPDELPSGNSTLGITATQPETGATGVFLNSIIRITFSEAMDTAAAQAAFSMSPAGMCDFNWSQNDTVLACLPVEDFAADTSYTVSIGTGAEAKSGNRLATPRSLAFTTGSMPAPSCVFGSARFSACVF